MTGPLLEMRGLGVALRGRTVLDDVSLSVEPSELIGLIGPNGAGKTTLLRAALGLVPASGDRLLQGQPLRRLTARERAIRASYLPQGRELAWPMRADAIVALGRLPHRPPGGGLSAADRKAVEAAISAMELCPLRDRPGTALSGGERARVMIARMLAQESPLLLADEPTAGLDPEHQIGLMQTFSSLAATGRAIMLSLHDLGLAARWCSRLVLLDQGQLVADGTPEKVLTPERLADVYGVRAHIGEAAGGLIIQPISRERI